MRLLKQTLSFTLLLFVNSTYAQQWQPIHSFDREGPPTALPTIVEDCDYRLRYTGASSTYLTDLNFSATDSSTGDVTLSGYFPFPNVPELISEGAFGPDVIPFLERFGETDTVSDSRLIVQGDQVQLLYTIAPDRRTPFTTMKHSATGYHFSLEERCFEEGRSPTASSNYDTRFTIANAFDGSRGSLWVGGRNQVDWTITIPTNPRENLTGINIDWYGSYYAKELTIEVKDRDKNTLYQQEFSGQTSTVNFGNLEGAYEIVIVITEPNNRFPAIREINLAR